MSGSISAYRIAVDLMLGGDLAPGIESLVPGLENLDRLLTTANEQAAGLAKGLRGVAAQAAGINRTAEALQSVASAVEAVNQRVAEHVSGGGLPGSASSGGGGGGRSGRSRGGALVPVPDGPNFTMPPGEGSRSLEVAHDAPYFDGDEPSIRLNPNGTPEQERGSARRGGSGHMPGAFDFVLPAIVSGEALKHVFDASFSVAAQESALLSNGWTPDQVKRARELAQQIQVDTPGSTIGGNMEVVKDLGVLFRKADGTPDTDTALSALPAYAKDALLLSAHGRGDGVADLFKAAQAGDLKGELSKPGTDEIDPEKFTEFVHKIMLADRVTGGRVTPQMILQNVRTGGVAAAMMDDKDFFGANLAMIEGLGSQAASALSGFNRQFGAGRMGHGIAEELEGVFPHFAGHWHSVGMGQVMVDPGAMGDPEELAKHPFEFIRNTLMPGIDKLIRARTPGFDAMAPDQKLVLESQEGSRIAASVTGSKEIVEVMRLWPQMVREQAAFEKEQHIDVYKTEQDNNPEVRVKALTAALNAFEVSLGDAGMQPAISVLGSLTTALNAVAAFSKAHPDGVEIALKGLAAGILVFAGAAVVAAIAALGAPAAGLAAVAAGLVALWSAVEKFAGIGHLLGNPTPGKPDPKFFNDDGSVHFFPGAYHPSPAQSAAPIVQHVTYIQLDKRTIGRAVTEWQMQAVGGQVGGTLRPDPSIAPQYGAHLVET